MKILASTRVYETYEDYVNSGKFNDQQLRQIYYGFNAGLSPKAISLYADPAFDATQMQILCMALDKGIPRRLVTVIADPRFYPGQMRELWHCIEDNPPIEALDLVADPKFSPDQMHEIIGAMYADGVSLDNIRVFAKPEFTRPQMHQARLAISEYAISDEDFVKYTNPSYSPAMLRVLYTAAESGRYDDSDMDTFIDLCQTRDISDMPPDRLGYLLSAIHYGFSKNYIDYLFFEQSFDQRQLYEILIGCHEGLTPDEVMTYASVDLSPDLMTQARYNLEDAKLGADRSNKWG